MTSATEKNRMTLGSSEQTDDAIAELRKTVRDAFSGESVSMLVEGNAIMQAIDKVEIATLGSEREKALEKLVQYALDEGHIDEWWYEDALKLGLEANY